MMKIMVTIFLRNVVLDGIAVNIIIRNGLIDSIFPYDNSFPVPEDAEMMDCDGKVAVPAFVNMHTRYDYIQRPVLVHANGL